MSDEQHVVQEATDLGVTLTMGHFWCEAGWRDPATDLAVIRADGSAFDRSLWNPRRCDPDNCRRHR